MVNKNIFGWKKLVEGYPWFSGSGKYNIPAYSEFMPPPRLGRRAYGELDVSLFDEKDDFGWNVSEVEEEYELQPGLKHLAEQIMKEIVELGQGKPAYIINGHLGRNLKDNPYWPPDLAEQAGKLFHERYVILLPLALSKTQDDKGRIRWTFFGGSEQGPEKAFWKSFYHSPGVESSPEKSLSWLAKLISNAYNEKCNGPEDLYKIGFRILSSEVDSRFPYWHETNLPSWTKSYILKEDSPLENIHYLLTFRPFSRLPDAIRKRYLEGQLVLLPFPGSLVFWGMPGYLRLQNSLPLAIQIPLERLVSRHGGGEGIKVPQSGRFHESGRELKAPEVHPRLLINTYKRTSRWDRMHRHEDDITNSTIEDTVGRILFSTDLKSMGLYGKPMARNVQLWTLDSQLLLDGPRAKRRDLEKAELMVAEGGTFGYRFQFPAMRIGLYEVYWQRPLVAYWSSQKDKPEMISHNLLGYLTAYPLDKPDLANPVELWPRLQHREPYILALRNFEHIKAHYHHQTALNIIRFLDTCRRWEGKNLPRSLARQILHLPEDETLEHWLDNIPKQSANHEDGKKLQETLESCLEKPVSRASTGLPGTPHPASLPQPLTFKYTANRSFEIAWWNDIRLLTSGEYVNTNNADCVQDPVTLSLLAHRHRDLEAMGDYLLSRYQQEILSTGMKGQAMCGELRFHWETDFDFTLFGGWKNDQEGHTHERDLIVIIPGKNRKEAVAMADHYDTAYMEDIYKRYSAKGGARIAATGADDNHSATATLLQAAPIFLELSRKGLLERDIWLVHLTGEEFPSDCLGSRQLAQQLVEGTLQIRQPAGAITELSDTRIVGVFVMDMIGHNREVEQDVFQISPGRGRASLKLAWQAHLANIFWNTGAKQWNRIGDRRGKHAKPHSHDGLQIPPISKHPILQGEVRLSEDPHSSLYNTDGLIFSDCGIPVVLFMENYDINRTGYHDSQDTLKNIDLDYGAALAAIAIESAALTANDES